MLFRFDGVNPELQNRAKSESGFEDVSRSIFIDGGAILGSLLESKNDKKQANNQVNFGNDFRWDFGRFCDKMGPNRGRPSGRGEAAGGLNSLTESDKS